VLLALIVCLAALTTVNAAIFTAPAPITERSGAISRCLRRLGRGRESGSTPGNALLLQGVIALALVLIASFTRWFSVSGSAGKTQTPRLRL